MKIVPAGLPLSNPRRGKPRRYPVPKENRVESACGCILLPEAVAKLAEDTGRVQCPEHGWQDIIQEVAAREYYQEILGEPIESFYPDEPPF